MKCILCNQPSSLKEIYRDVEIYQCSNCHCAFKDPTQYVSQMEEHDVYRAHNNDIHDERYLKFVSPTIQAITSTLPSSAKGLDFGCGSGPIVSYHLSKLGYKMSLYDPLFYPDTHVLTRTYDFIVLSEVLEHFKNPYLELQHLFALLNPNGKLVCMTHPFDDSTNFKAWYYLKDPTHIFFVQQKTIEWIANTFDVTVTVNHRTIVFTTSPALANRENQESHQNI